MNVALMDMDRSVRPADGLRRVGIWELICWAFQREFASLDFGEQDSGTETRRAVDPICRMIEINRLGRRVQGGGRSEPHHDADIVAGTLAVLPEGCGGRRMAVWIAELARAGRMPDWHTVPVVRPAQVVTNRYGMRARTADAAELGAAGWPSQPRRRRNGQIIQEPVLYCAVEIRPTARELAAMRRAYLQWWSALLELKSALEISHLTSHVLTGDMPLCAPWKKGA